MNDRVLRVIVADDHPVFREGLRASLSSENDIEVVAECGDGPTVVAHATTARPDVVLMDIRMPGMNGIEATRRIISAAPDTRMLMLTMFDDDESVFEAMRAGARGYLLKGSEPADIARAVRAVAEGDAIFGPSIAERMMALFARRSAKPFPMLTERSTQLLEMIAEGRNNQAIAHELEAERRDGPKLRLDGLQQAPGCGSRRGDAQGAHRRPGAGSTLVATGQSDRRKRRASTIISPAPRKSGSPTTGCCPARGPSPVALRRPRRCSGAEALARPVLVSDNRGHLSGDGTRPSGRRSHDAKCSMRIVYFYFMKDSADRARAVAPRHADYWKQLELHGYVGGPFADRSGGLITFESESTEEAERLVANDPFIREGLLDRYWVKEWVR